MRGKFDRQRIQLSNLSESVRGYKAESAKQKEELALLHARNGTLRRTQQNTAERANTLEQQLVTEQGQTKVLTRQLERQEAELADLHKANDECVAVAVDLQRGLTVRGSAQAARQIYESSQRVPETAGYGARSN
jgi:hypothetical protein